MFCKNCRKKMQKSVGEYQYKECGLDDVVLVNIPLYKCKCGVTYPIISHMDELHKVIASEIVTRKEPLNGQRIRFLRKMLGMKATELANVLGVRKQTVSAWENEKQTIGAAYDKLIRIIYIQPTFSEFIENLQPAAGREMKVDFPTFLMDRKSKEIIDKLCQ
jgi:putative zinc finger/helix-turn-helix YgiT family protein